MITDDPMPLQHHLVGVLLNQMSAKQDIKKHSMRAKEVLFTEFLQLCDMDTFIPMHKGDLTKEQVREALIAISVIKEKSDGILKERTIAFGKKQRGLYEKHETFSPTVHTDSFMATTAIEAKEGHYVITGDIKGAFLHA